MRPGDLLALGLAAGILAFMATQRQPPPPLPPPPEPEPDIPFVRAATRVDTDLKDEADDRSATLRRLPRTTIVALERSSEVEGWAVATVHSPLPITQGYVRIRDLTFEGV